MLIFSFMHPIFDEKNGTRLTLQYLQRQDVFHDDDSC